MTNKNINLNLSSLTGLLKDLGFKSPFERRERIKIAVSGSNGSGKTYFIASAINQLLSGKKIQRLARERNIEFVGRLISDNNHVNLIDDNNNSKSGSGSAVISQFPYRTIVDISKGEEGKWLGSTTGVSRALIELEIKSNNKFFANRFLEIEFIDYPGEWLSDLQLYGKSFSDWGDEVIADIRTSSQKREFAKDWLNSLSSLDIYSYSDGTNDEEIVENYRKYLKSLLLNGFTFVQPSRHLYQTSVADPSIILFSPLPKPKFLNAHEDSIYSRFSRRYTRYLKEYVLPVYESWFKDFDRQVVLLDLFKPLAHGKNSLNDLSGSIWQIVQLYKYGSNNILKYLTGRKVDRVLFCATKSDLILENQRENLLKLLSNTVEEASRELKLQNIDTTILAVASVEGRLKNAIDDNLIIPDKIENVIGNLKIGKANPPEFPERDIEALKHINMDIAIEKLIGDKL